MPEVLEAQLTPLAASQDWLLGTAGQAFGTWERMITTGFGIGPDGKPFKAGMRSTSPVVAAEDPGAEVLAEFTGTGGGAALAAKDRGGWTAVYCGTLAVPSWLIRGLARKAGVHLWADVDEIVYANRHFLAIHSDRGGNRTLRLPRNCSVLDCSSAEVVAEESEELMVAFASPGSDWAGTEIFFLGNNREVARARQFLLSRRSFA